MAPIPDSISLRSLSRGSRHSYAAVSPIHDEISENDKSGTETTWNPDEGDQEPQKQTLSAPPSARLHRSGYILFTVFLYIGLAVFAWVVTCYLSFRPITTKHYDLQALDNGNWALPDRNYQNPLFGRNEQWYRAARIIQSVVGILTIPLTSAVCSSAAVIFIQQRAHKGITVRQVMTLADKGWADLATYARILPFLTTDEWKRFGSSFLLLAILLNLLGSVISPLQQLFLSTRTIKIPTYPSFITGQLDIPDQFQGAADGDSNLVVAMTRSALTSTTISEVQSQLWQGANVTCVRKYGSEELPQSCRYGGSTLANMSQLVEPFLAELPSGYNTGLYQQFIPRFNSSAQYDKITHSEFPTGCDKIDGAFYVDYTNVTTDPNGLEYIWGIQACMPRDLTTSPWKSTRDRQDFTEELYLNVTLNQYYTNINQQGSTFYKVTLDTTAGYFELPNYMNSEIAGPLLEKDPNGLCGEYCEPETINGDEEHKIGDKRRDLNFAEDQTLPLEVVANKGPLLTIAMALFGDTSFIQSRQAYPQAYASVIDFNVPVEQVPAYAGSCVDLAPLAILLAGISGEYAGTNGIDYCISNTDGGVNGTDVNTEVAWWISNFNYEEERVRNAFNAAAFLANRAWMQNSVTPAAKSLTVNFDLGADTQIPVISRGGMIFVSILLGLYTLMLIPLAIYATWTPRWTEQLDSFAMMRIGATIAGKLPLTVGQNNNTIKSLDEIPGWIGDISGGKEPLGRLGLGAGRPLASRANRRFECEEEDNEDITAEEKIAARRRLEKESEKSTRVDHGEEAQWAMSNTR
ncbi:uncharacterized protein N7482_001246 [Penicillium canariense]|uniref:Uncharacterized protein n=1 Tax=Penicillium canariense TaxID=189055 RepID=A0A9W9LTQ6_9EURO|nr:uncharacterized protein N7482_001246 [Penicillium canariense]KAJ5175369.1 hypothetical protein N7482_001246 [Penicillium canariense]